MNRSAAQILFLFLGLLFAACRKTAPEDDPLQKQVEEAIEISTLIDSQGNTYKLLADGRLFVKLSGTANWVFKEQYFDPAFVDKNYTFSDGKVYRKIGTGSTVLITNKLFENFEGLTDNLAFIKKSPTDTIGKWIDITLQSPAAPTIADYVSLRKCIMNRTCTFIDNFVSLASNPENSNDTVMRFHAVSPTSSMVTSKASIENSLNYFIKGDDLWFEAKYFINKMPFGLVDFETSWFNESPGPRLVVVDSCLAVELKFGNKPMFYSRVKLPVGEWVNIKIHLVFNDTPSGTMQVWQNGQLIINTTGQTLPTSNCVISNLEIGITATDSEADLLMDNVRLY